MPEWLIGINSQDILAFIGGLTVAFVMAHVLSGLSEFFWPTDENPDKYSCRILWSWEDKVFIALSPEFPGVIAHGESREEAARQLGDTLTGAAMTLGEEEEDIPRPVFWDG